MRKGMQNDMQDEMDDVLFIEITRGNAREFQRYFPERSPEILYAMGFCGFGLMLKTNDGGEEPIGAILCLADEPEKAAEIESFFVDPDYRENGYGEKLLVTLIEYLQERGIDFLETQLAYPADVRGASFLVGHGFLYEDDAYQSYEIRGSAVKKLVEAEKTLGDSGKLGMLTKFPHGDFRRMEDLSNKQIVDLRQGPAKPFADKDEVGWLAVDRHLSFVSVTEDMPRSAVLITRRGGKKYFLSWLDAVKKGRTEVVSLLLSALTALADEIDDDATLYFAAMTEGAESIVQAAIEDLGGEEQVGGDMKKQTIKFLSRYIKRNSAYELLYGEG